MGRSGQELIPFVVPGGMGLVVAVVVVPRVSRVVSDGGVRGEGVRRLVRVRVRVVGLGRQMERHLPPGGKEPEHQEKAAGHPEDPTETGATWTRRRQER